MLATLRRRFDAWIQIRHVPQPGPLTVRRGRLYILPTRAGFGFGLMLFAMLMGAINYSNNLAFALTFLLGGLGMVCMHATNSNLIQLSARLGRIEPVFAGDPVKLPIVLHNPTGLARLGLQLGLDRESALQANCVDVLPQTDTTATVVLPHSRRGEWPLPRLALVTEFPLGFFHAWSWLSFSQRYLVYPQPAQDAPPLPVSRGSDAGRGHLPDGTDEFSGLREYRRGDALNAIHWKRFAIDHQLHVKQFSDPTSESVQLSLDLCPPALGIEDALSLLCRWVLDCDAKGRAYGLSIDDEILPPDRGPAHRHHCLAALARHGSPSA